ncbi:TPA: dual specificity protein phosphatase family protein [Pseudomonas aeruginosa]|nr:MULTISPECIES: dual specificity protein phosphatase family protein [Pseudomonadaceae]KEX90273.1 hypothetical protein HA62_32930 [Pseudomonas putida]MBT9571907.1 dual specificity protein phosphatase family protein [Pseudomonas umsongensis]MBA1264397.1 hypothetical protein [Stutzerimonas stutzeri]MBK3468120.1 dual specificity protein phosphatase family protein [Pseudomonas sp. MF6776]RPM52773.1 hypothetical protein IPC1288_28435 [Pseudomonas aeruginosa]
MHRTIPSCTFLSRSDAEAYSQGPDWHLISISDGLEDQARIDEARWKSVSYHHFIDAGFDEEVIEIYGPDFERNYVDYLLSGKADVLRERIREITDRGENIAVNCQAGRSRSAAVALYISKHYGYQLHKPTPDANQCVYRMLANDVHLMAAYRAASTPVEPEAPKRSLLSAIKSMFS